MTDYQHPTADRNLMGVQNAMKYDADGEPSLRVSIENIESNAGIIYVSDTSSHPVSEFACIDNYDDAGTNIGWKFQDDWIPIFGLRVKPGSEREFHLIDFSITLNGGTSVVAGYRWHQNPTLNATYTWTDLKTTGVQYVKFEDTDGTPNQITSDTMVHSQALVGKTTNELTPEMKMFPFTDGGIEMFLEIRRLDGGATQDLFYHLTMGID
jgi:hypothetical protein